MQLDPVQPFFQWRPPIIRNAHVLVMLYCHIRNLFAIKGIRENVGMRVYKPRK